MYNLTTLYINSGRNKRTETIAFIENEMINMQFIGEAHLEDRETKGGNGFMKINNIKIVKMK
jgi:hypothetical protein